MQAKNFLFLLGERKKKHRVRTITDRKQGYDEKKLPMVFIEKKNCPWNKSHVC